MKKILIISFAVVALSSVAFNTFVNCSATQNAGVDLANVEALSVCEVSADPALNQGYCTTLKDTNIEVCVTEGNGGSVRCSGTILL